MGPARARRSFFGEGNGIISSFLLDPVAEKPHFASLRCICMHLQFGLRNRHNHHRCTCAHHWSWSGLAIPSRLPAGTFLFHCRGAPDPNGCGSSGGQELTSSLRCFVQGLAVEKRSSDECDYQGPDAILSAGCIPANKTKCGGIPREPICCHSDGGGPDSFADCCEAVTTTAPDITTTTTTTTSKNEAIQ